MKEANFQTLFGNHLKLTNPPLTNVFELKIIKDNKPFTFNRVAEHQIAGLLQAKEGQYIKLQDMSAVNNFSNPKPYDCLWVQADHAWIILFFYHPREPKKFYGIEINDFVKLKETWKRKSIRENELMSTNLVRVLKLITK
jgi:penicillin-binding protein-related factor A (putative recombinase)